MIRSTIIAIVAALVTVPAMAHEPSTPQAQIEATTASDAVNMTPHACVGEIYSSRGSDSARSVKSCKLANGNTAWVARLDTPEGAKHYIVGVDVRGAGDCWQDRGADGTPLWSGDIGCD